jgi:hypothetical protein
MATNAGTALPANTTSAPAVASSATGSAMAAGATSEPGTPNPASSAVSPDHARSFCSAATRKAAATTSRAASATAAKLTRAQDRRCAYPPR